MQFELTGERASDGASTLKTHAPNAKIARLEKPSGPPNAVVAEGRDRGKTPMLMPPRKNGLDSLFEEIRVFNVRGLGTSRLEILQ